MIKNILSNQPLCTIEPNVSKVEVPDPQDARPDDKRENSARMHWFSEDAVLVLPRGN
jgi:ribosome-binding ATPase YchF (GTP1/OBG family)